MIYQVVLSRIARRFFESSPASLQRRLDRCFEILKNNPRQHPNIKLLKGKLAGVYRFRLGDYRIVYEIDHRQHVVVVIIIAHRSGVYD